MTKAHKLHELGQSVWLDYIRRSFIVDGGLQEAIAKGVRGVTSNPSIFEKAIAGSSDYDEDMAPLVEANKSIEEIYEALAVDDIQRAADVLRPVFDESNGSDGYVSLEVSPRLAHDTNGTIEEARRLFAQVDHPNVMIKVPATPAGIPAIETLIGEGININVTLIFSLSQYEDVAHAYIAGLEKLAESGGDLSKVASVASFFVSRVETSVDKALEAANNTELQGKIAVANAKVAYARFQELFGDDRWQKLADKNAHVQRPLWASTGTKNPAYSDTVYVDELIGPHTVNTMPPDTLDAFLDHGTAASTIENGVDEAKVQIAQLATIGVDFDAITQELQDDGVDKFAKSFDSLMAGIGEKYTKLKDEEMNIETSLREHEAAVNAARAEMRNDNIMHRIWDHDHTVWSDSPDEITNRLGWLRVADTTRSGLERIHKVVEKVKADGYTHALLLGMGGSSLAPEVFKRTFGVADGYLDLYVLDSTDPGTVLAYDNQLDLSKTLFIVATKSGGTAETLSFFKYFYNRVSDELGKDKAGEHFIAITDPGSKLEAMADQFHFRATFLNDPNIGGRYSALSYFGIVPAALLGVDAEKLLDRASTMAVNCSRYNCPSEGDNYGGIIGAIMGELAKAGRDKITFIISPQIESYGDWVEQLIAESTGKEGKGILPVVGEPVGTPDVYSNDRLFVYLNLTNDSTNDTAVQTLQDAGHPIIRVTLKDLYDVGGQFFLWEMATAVAGYRLSINPFDQPNVESAKVLARQMIEAYQKEGKLPELEATLESDGIAVYGDVQADSTPNAMKAFLGQIKSGDYVAIQAYIQPTPEADEALLAMRTQIRDMHKVATTVGYGPRFLHSTGQLHKGDAGNGLFIQFTADMPQDVDIPDNAGEAESGMSFGTLKLSQALGDRQALLDENRRVIRFDLGADVKAAIAKLIQ